MLVLAACADVPFIDEVTIVNETEYSANVDVRGRERDGRLGLTSVPARSTRTVDRVIDQGDLWIFSFDYGGKHEEEVEVSRGELQRSDWTIEVPTSFEQRLRELGVPPPP
jgi:hypothetical protein